MPITDHVFVGADTMKERYDVFNIAFHKRELRPERSHAAALYFERRRGTDRSYFMVYGK